MRIVVRSLHAGMIAQHTVRRADIPNPSFALVIRPPASMGIPFLGTTPLWIVVLGTHRFLYPAFHRRRFGGVEHCGDVEVRSWRACGAPLYVLWPAPPSTELNMAAGGKRTVGGSLTQRLKGSGSCRLRQVSSAFVMSLRSDTNHVLGANRYDQPRDCERP